MLYNNLRRYQQLKKEFMLGRLKDTILCIKFKFFILPWKKVRRKLSSTHRRYRDPKSVSLLQKYVKKDNAYLT